MRPIPLLALMVLALPVPAMAQPSTPPAPKVTSSDNCLFGVPADAGQIAAAKTVTIVKCKMTAPLASDASVDAALQQNKATKAATDGLTPNDVLATTVSGSNVTIYVNDTGN